MCICPKYQSHKIYKAKTDRTEKTDNSVIIVEDFDAYVTNGKQKIMGRTHLNSFYKASVTNENCRLIAFINIDTNILIKH